MAQDLLVAGPMLPNLKTPTRNLAMRETAPFIWTSRQPVNPRAMLAGVTGARPRGEKQNRWFLFRREFDLADKFNSASLNVTVDGRYQLFINGVRVGRGPARCSPLFQRYDTWDIAPYLKPGRNTVGLIIRVFGKDMSWYEKVKGLWQGVFGDGGLWLSGEVEYPGKTVSWKSDLGWRCLECGAWQQDTPQANHGLGFIEVLDARKLPDGWMAHGFNDAGWDDVQIMEAGGGGPEAPFGGLVSRPFPHLLPNRLKPLAEDEVAPLGIAWIKEAAPVEGVPFYDEVYCEPLSDLAECSIIDCDAMLYPGEGAALVTTAEGNGVSILFDFGKVITLHPKIEVEAKGGEIIDIAVSERLPDEWLLNGPAPGSRITRTELLGLDAHLSRYIAKPGTQQFERFEWQAAKWMQITVRNADAGLKILSVGGLYTRYPAQARGSFSCSDPMLTKLWETGRYTLQQCMHDGWEDCPSREQRQWLGDATIENLVGHAAFGPDITLINAEFIRKCAESQRPDGLTQMFAPGNHGTDGMLIPDWTLQWILNTANHLRLTGDLDVVEEVFPSIQKALAWFERSMGRSGLVQNVPYWLFMDWAGIGREGEVCSLNAQLAGSYKAGSVLAEALEMPRTAERYRALAAHICATLNVTHWDERRGVYVDSVDTQKGEQAKRVSQHSNAAMILWGDAPEARWPRMVAWMTDPEKITFTAAPPIANTGQTLNEETGVVMANTFYSHFVFEALAQAGRLDLVFGFIRDRYGPMIDRGATTLWESFEPTASLCHGFSASPTWQMSARILGVRRDKSGGRITFNPNLLGLDHANGTIAFTEGDVAVSLLATKRGFEADIALPCGLETDIIPPPGYRLIEPFDGAHIEGSAKLIFEQI